MSIIGEFSIPASSFALEEALAEYPSAVVEAERMATHSTMEVIPFLWSTGVDAEAFHAAFEADPSVESAIISENADDGVLYKMAWHERFRDLIDSIVDHHGSLVEATATDGTWYLKLRFAEEGPVTEFQDHFREEGRDFEVERLYQPSRPRQREYDLTPEQRDTLVAAYEAGYFDVPRSSSTADLAADLGISANAVSARLRRGLATSSTTPSSSTRALSATRSDEHVPSS